MPVFEVIKDELLIIFTYYPNTNEHLQGDQRQGKSGRIREFQSHVFKIRESQGKNQGFLTVWRLVTL